MAMIRPRRPNGFTLIELLIVVAIIGLIAAVAIPNLLGAMNKARQKKCMAELKEISHAVEMYQIDVRYYPIVPTLTSLATLNPASIGLEPRYMQKVPTEDGFGGFYYYGSDTAGQGSAYTLVSYGRDKKPSPSFGQTKHYDCDIIFENGAFTAYPEGIQT